MFRDCLTWLQIVSLAWMHSFSVTRKILKLRSRLFFLKNFLSVHDFSCHSIYCHYFFKFCIYLDNFIDLYRKGITSLNRCKRMSGSTSIVTECWLLFNSSAFNIILWSKIDCCNINLLNYIEIRYSRLHSKVITTSLKRPVTNFIWFYLLYYDVHWDQWVR